MGRGRRERIIEGVSHQDVPCAAGEADCFVDDKDPAGPVLPDCLCMRIVIGPEIGPVLDLDWRL